MYGVGCMVASDVSAFPGIRYMVPKDGSWRDQATQAYK